VVKWQHECNVCDKSPDDPKEGAAIRKKAPRFYYNASTWTLYHRRIMEAYYDDFHTKRHMWRLKKLMTVHVELTNQDLIAETCSKDLATSGWRWSLMLLLMLSDAMPVRSTETSSIKHQEIFIKRLLHGHLRCREWILLNPLALQHPKDITSSGHNRLLL